MEITFSKIYLVTDEDYASLRQAAGVPANYEQLFLCENNSQTVIRQIEQGTITAFTTGKLLPWCYTVPGGNPHSHQFIKVPAACNGNVAEAIRRYSDQIIARCGYMLQEKNPPHDMGQSSWSIIFQDRLKMQSGTTMQQ